MNISLAPEILFHFYGIGITNTYIVAVIIVFLALIFGIYLKIRGARLIPTGIQNVLESLFELWLATIDSVTGDRKLSYKIFTLVVTVFLFVLFSNLVELVPGLGTVGVYGIHNGHVALIPFIRSSSADLNFTLAIAVIVMSSTWFFGIREIGISGHLSKFFTLKGPIDAFVGILEFVGEFAKIISFSFRLFGNIFAGEVLLIVIAFLVPYVAGLPFLFLELFVGFVQALVFSMLALVFLKMSTVSHQAH